MHIKKLIINAKYRLYDWEIRVKTLLFDLLLLIRSFISLVPAAGDL